MTAKASDPIAGALDEIRKRAEAATKGPWAVAAEHGSDVSGEGWSDERVIAPSPEGGEAVAITYLTDVLEGDPLDENGVFIAHARTDVPRLLAAVDAVLALAGRWRAAGDGQDAQSECAADVRATIARVLGEQ